MYILIFILISLCEPMPIRPDTVITITLKPREIRQVECQMNSGYLRSLSGMLFKVTYYTNGCMAGLCFDRVCDVKDSGPTITSMFIHNTTDYDENTIYIVCSANDGVIITFIILLGLVGLCVILVFKHLCIAHGIKEIIKRCNICDFGDDVQLNDSFSNDGKL